jgi:hypothetical protein
VSQVQVKLRNTQHEQMSSVQRRYLTNPRPPRLGAYTSAPLTLVDLANMMLGVELKAELGDEVDLGFKEIDLIFLVAHQLLEERVS